MPASEDRVRNAVVGHIAAQGYSNNLTVKANDEHGPDIFATHRDSDARRAFIEAKGHSKKVNKTIGIQVAWGQIVSRITSLNSNRIHGLAFPSEWEDNVAKLSSHIVARRLNIHYYFVSSGGQVREYTAAQFQRKHAD
jgi:hypothetical protein